MVDTMRAVVLDAPGPVENLQIRDLPVPEPPPGWVRIKVMAFGLNRSELHTRLGLAQGVTLPRVLGIEAVGVVDLDPERRPGPRPAGGHPDGRHGTRLRRRLRRVHRRTARPGHPVHLRPPVGGHRRCAGDTPDRLRLPHHRTRPDARARPCWCAAARHRSDSRQRPSPRTWARPCSPPLASPTASSRCWTTGSTTSSSTTDRSPTRSTTCWATASTPPSSSSAPRPCPTRCAPPASTAPSASPGCCRTSGPCRTSTPSTTSPPASDSPPTAAAAPTCLPTVLQHYLDRLAAGSASLGPIRVHQLEDIREAHLDLEHNRTFGKHVVLTHRA